MFTVTQWISQELINIVPDDLLTFISKVKEVNIETIRELLTPQEETVSPQKIGTVVDYLTRLVINQEFENTFKTILYGMVEVRKSYTFKSPQERSVYLEDEETYETWKEAIDEDEEEIVLSDKLIEEGVRIIEYESFYRDKKINLNHPKRPDEKTIENIRTLVERSVAFLDNYSSKIICGGDISALTSKISIGDWDYLTKDSLIDMKVSKSKPDKYSWLQLITYFLLGKVSRDPKFKSIDKLIVLNPKLAKVWILDVKDISEKLIDLIRTEWGEIVKDDCWREDL